MSNPPMTLYSKQPRLQDSLVSLLTKPENVGVSRCFLCPQISSSLSYRRSQDGMRFRGRSPRLWTRCSPRGNPACRGTFGGRRKAVRARLALHRPTPHRTCSGWRPSLRDLCFPLFPGSLAGNESTCNAGDPSLIPGLTKAETPVLWPPHEKS